MNILPGAPKWDKCVCCCSAPRSMHAVHSKSSLRLTRGLFKGLRGNPNAAEGARKQQLSPPPASCSIQQLSQQARQKQPVAPAFDHGRVIEFWVSRLRRWLCMGGGASHAFFFFPGSQ